mgnify:CR=1 FL=1
MSAQLVFDRGQRLAEVSRGIFEVNQGSLYPALQRLLRRGLIRAYYADSENNRRARYYGITPAGRAHLRAETRRWVGSGDVRPRYVDADRNGKREASEQGVPNVTVVLDGKYVVRTSRASSAATRRSGS